MNNLESLWSELGRNYSSGDESALRRIEVGDNVDAFIGMTYPQQNRFFAVRLDRQPESRHLKKLDTAGLKVFPVELPQFSKDDVYLGIFLEDSGFTDIFNSFLMNIITILKTVEADQEILPALIKCVNEWKRFLDESEAEILSIEAQRGLFGELTTLRRLLTTAIGIALIESWSGAEAAPKDFEFISTAMEVKSTFGSSLSTLKISSLNQLEVGSFEALYLAHNRFEIVLQGGVSLNQLVSAIRSSIRHTLYETKFEDSLMSVGYRDEHAESYTEQYMLHKVKYYQITDGFPCLTRETVPSGVASAQYEISIGTYDQFEVTEADVMERAKI